MQAMTKLAQTLQSGFAVTAECVPQTGADGSSIRELADHVPNGVGAVVIADNHDAIRASALASAALLASQGVEPVLPLLTRDRNRIALQSDALGAAALGVSNILCLTGDHQSLGVSPEAAGAFDIDSIQLLAMLKAMRDEGVLADGTPLEAAPAFFLGAAAHPNLRPLELSLLDVRKKIAAGAQFLITQPVTDVAAFEGWMDAVRKAGLHERASIIAAVEPRESDGDGVARCAETASKLRGVEGVRGIHIHSGASLEKAASVIREAGLAGR